MLLSVLQLHSVHDVHLTSTLKVSDVLIQYTSTDCTVLIKFLMLSATTVTFGHLMIIGSKLLPIIMTKIWGASRYTSILPIFKKLPYTPPAHGLKLLISLIILIIIL